MMQMTFSDRYAREQNLLNRNELNNDGREYVNRTCTSR